MLLQKTDIDALPYKYRLHLINSITGIKPANLIGTRSPEGIDNLAIFSSIVHLGSSPAQIGMVMRPQNPEIKDTFSNIQETGVYSINHVSASFIKKAHYTSAKLPHEISEFDRMKIERENIEGFHAPFVKESAIKIGMKHLESIPLPNGCIFIVGEIELLDYPEEAVAEDGQIDLSSYDCVGISGLNNYYSLHKIANFPYARLDEIPSFG